MRGAYRGKGFGPNAGYPYHSRPNTPYAPQPKPPLKAEPCVIFTRTGKCDQRKTCRYQHDPGHVAVCQQYLKSGRCSKSGGERCYLSHKPQAENTPMCKHFARGQCNNAACKFIHMKNLGEDPSNAPICRAFALNGWCDRGERCTKRHSFDCPDFDAHGTCANPNCTLEHVIKHTISDGAVTSVPSKRDRALDARYSVNLEKFLDFVKTADRKAFDADTHHYSDTVRDVSEENEASETSEESEDDLDSDSEWDWDADNNEGMDVTADFIKV